MTEKLASNAPADNEIAQPGSSYLEQNTPERLELDWESAHSTRWLLLVTLISLYAGGLFEGHSAYVMHAVTLNPGPNNILKLVFLTSLVAFVVAGIVELKRRKRLVVDQKILELRWKFLRSLRGRFFVIALICFGLGIMVAGQQWRSLFFLFLTYLLSGGLVASLLACCLISIRTRKTRLQLKAIESPGTVSKGTGESVGTS